MSTARQRIAIIGSGISGAGAAAALSRCHDVTLYELRERPGGHAATVDIEYDGTPVAVDTGFIVYNELNYPNLTRLFDHLKVETKPTDMSFGVSMNAGALEWSGKTLASVFAQKRNLVSPRFLRMLIDMFRFNANARRELEEGAMDGLSLGDYLAMKGFGPGFIDDYLVPMGAAIWSTPDAEIKAFPAASFVRFFANHRLIDFDRPLWRTVEGGSRSYVRKLLAPLGARVLTDTPIARVARSDDGVILTDVRGNTKTFDVCVMATHADQALKILADADAAETAVLSAIRYLPNDVWLHCDESLMPKRRAVWSAWNYLSSPVGADGASKVAVSYSMNILQGIADDKPLFITLNPPREPQADKVFGRYSYSHPQYDAPALQAQTRLAGIQGKNRLYFCGAWTGYGFHEDGLRSGLEVARALGAPAPWESLPERGAPS